MDEQDNEILLLVKQRLNKLRGITAADDYLRERIKAAREELKGNGITLREENPADTMLLVDKVVWQYNNRDSNEDDPASLRRREKNRWL